MRTPHCSPCLKTILQLTTLSLPVHKGEEEFEARDFGLPLKREEMLWRVCEQKSSAVMFLLFEGIKLLYVKMDLNI